MRLPALVYVLAAVFALRSALAWVLLDAGLTPDTDLYAQGGLGLFPSPLGRLAGFAGAHELALLNAAAGLLLVLGVARLARDRGGRPTWAAALLLVTPLGVWSIFAGVDTIAASALVWALIAADRGHRTRSKALGGIAAGFHLAAILVVAAVALVRSVPTRGSISLGLAAGCLGLALALVTPYRGLVLDLDPITATSSALATGAVFALTFAPFLPRLSAAVPYALGGAIAAGLVAGRPWETNCRYMLPAVAIAAAVSTSKGGAPRVGMA